MALIRPFAALRPAPGFAADVIAPPYDVLSAAEAQAQAQGRPWSFLHISRAEVDLPEGTDPYNAAVYAKAAENLERMLDQGVLVQDAAACLYAYRMDLGEHKQTGLAAVASVAAYQAGRIRRHEFTRPDKEDDRVNQIKALAAQTGPVLLAYRAHPVIDELLDRATCGQPEVDVTAADGVRHRLWCLDADLSAELAAHVDRLPALYIADGHHRAAAAARVAADRRQANPGHTGEEAYNYFLAVLFPHDQMQILDYNRVVRDLNGLDAQAFLAAVGEAFVVELADEAVKPRTKGEFGMYLPGRWFRLHIKPARIGADDPVARLDVSLLSDHLLEPILGIHDPRRDARIDFVGGSRGLTELERRVNEGGMAVAFSLFPTRMDELLAVADAGEVMPPKSTWFEPKLADGLLSHLID